jgi:hypothetical protein
MYESTIKDQNFIGTASGMIGILRRIDWNEPPDSLAKVAGISNIIKGMEKRNF